MPNLRLYNSSGVLGGYFVYTLICRDGDGPLYVKIGMSQNPVKRFGEIRNGNPVTPLTLAWVDLCSKDKASSVESQMQIAATAWHHTLEWFKVDADDFDDFKAVCKDVLIRNGHPGRPKLTWTHVDAKSLILDGQQRKAKFYRMFKQKGPAYADFLAAVGKA